MEIFKRDARKHFINGVAWILMMALMIACIVVDINAGNWGLAVFAMFACSCDGFNAFMDFRSWWHCYQTYKLLKEDKDLLNRICKTA